MKRRCGKEGGEGRIKGMNTNNGWNAKRWAVSFGIASERLAQARAEHRRDWDADQAIHQLRADVFRDTVARVRAGGYLLPGAGRIDLALSQDIGADTRFYAEELPPGPGAAPDAAPAAVEVEGGDCLAAARRLVEAGEPETCVLNMASATTPGGGVYNGAGAQEEHLFRSSDLYRSLYRFAEFGVDYGIPRAPQRYPLRGDGAGIFTRGATVFRGPEPDGYPLLERPWKCNFVSVPAVSHPETVAGPDGAPRLAPGPEESMRRRIRTILRVARANGQRALVLSAFGCGAFRNPPRHVAELFREALASPEFRAAFSRVVFAIVDDHNARGDGNLRPFRDVLGAAPPPPRAAGPAPVDAATASRELALVLLFLNRMEDRSLPGAPPRWRSWKDHDSGTLDDLARRGYLDPTRAANSVCLTDSGIAEARRLLAKYGIADRKK